MQSLPAVFVHIVTFNDESTIESTIRGILQQSYFLSGAVKLLVSDNASSDRTIEIVKANFTGQLELICHSENLGFCAAHNAGIFKFLQSEYELYLALNPDLRLEERALQVLVHAMQQKPEFGAACPRLLRADQNLNPVSPPRLDAAGMCIQRSLRHFDRGSEQLAQNQFLESSEVFGASGACLLMRRSFIEALSFRCDRDRDLFKVYPDLKNDYELRTPLFDEAFFAYREDADLAWRAQLLGQRYFYCADAIGYHQRLVLPERRGDLPEFVNALGVRNRFLLQLNNYSVFRNPEALISGFLFRNIVVLAAVILRERSSLIAFKQLAQLFARALNRRRYIFARAHNFSSMSKWFKEGHQ